MEAFGIALLILIVCILSGILIGHLIERAPSNYNNEITDEERVKFILTRCRHHRESLKAYHEQLCELHAVHPHSHEGDYLAHVIFDGEKYDDSI